jgi:tRNA/rRNA methyltransferase
LADPVRIVLASPRNPLNIGAVARAMSNFGFTDMHLVNPYDLAYKEARSAVKAGYILEGARVHSDIADAIAGCTLVAGTTAVGHRELHVPLYRLETAARLIREHAASGAQVAVVFGSEKFGLSNDDMSRCHWLTRIPTRTEHGSMNLGQAASICLYELRRDESAATLPAYEAPQAASAEELERLFSVVMKLLVESGYTRERTSQSSELKLRRLLTRLQIHPHDCEVLLGMLKQVLWKLQHPDISQQS